MFNKLLLSSGILTFIDVNVYGNSKKMDLILKKLGQSKQKFLSNIVKLLTM